MSDPSSPGASSEVLRAVLGEMVAAGAVSAAVARITRAGEVVAEAVAGEAPGPEAWFDLGSLTKPFTATLALVLDHQGLLPLGTQVVEVFAGAAPALAERTLEDLLRHRAGLIPWYPFYACCGECEAVVERLLAGDLLGAPAGTYSDLGFLLWGFAAERVSGQPLATLLRDQVLSPLGLDHTAPSPGRLAGLAPCRLDNGREVELAAALGLEVEAVASPPAGIVQDGNARFLSGLAAHAGLFATAGDLHRLAAEWLRPGRLLAAGQVAEALAGEGPYALGWARRDPEGGAAPLGETAFGHLGFPGGSLWIDPESERIFILLAHKTASTVDLTPWRRRFYALGMERR